MENRRKYPRIDVSVVVSYDCYNDDGEIFERGIGVALDVSQGGMQLETIGIIDANYVKVVFISFDKKAVGIVGSVVYSRKGENGKAKTGICFHEDERECIRFVSSLIRSHHYSKQRH